MLSKKFWTRLIALLMSLCMLCMTFAGCSNEAETNTGGTDPDSQTSSPSATQEAEGAVATKRTADDTLVYSLTFTSPKFDPADTVSDWATVIYMMYETLVYTDSHGNIYGGLASAWEWQDDTTIHFTLRDGVTFSDGTEMTGEDVLYSLERASGTNMGGAMLSQIDFDASYYEGNELYIILNRPNSEFIPYFARTFCAVVSKEYYETNGEDYAILNPMGTGPYVLTNFVEGESISFERNESYWGDAPEYQFVEIKVITEESTRALSFEAGEIDVALMTTPDTINTFAGREDSGVYVYPAQGSMQYWLSLGDFNDFFKIREVRLAVAHAVDWATLTTAVFGEYATLATGNAPFTSAYYQDFGGYEYNPDYARELLEQAGYGDGLTIEMAVSNTGYDVNICTIMREYLAEVGITLDLTVTDNATARTMSSSGQVHMSISQNSSISGTLTELWDPHLTGSGSLLQEIHTDYEAGATFQEMIVEYQQTYDEAEKENLAIEIQQFIYDECLWIPIANIQNVFVAYDYVEGIETFLDTWVVNSGPHIEFLAGVTVS